MHLTELHEAVMKEINKKCRHSNEAAQPATYLSVLPLSAVQLLAREPKAPIRLF